MQMLLSRLELKLILRIIDKLEKFTETEDIKNLIQDCKLELQNINDTPSLLEITTENKYYICSILDTLYSVFSLLLSEVRIDKRQTLTSVFETHPKLLEEKSVLERKLDAIPEYAKCKEKEEYLFQFLEHIKSVKENIIWLVKIVDDDLNDGQ